MGYAPESTPTQNPSSRGHKQIHIGDTDGPVHSVLILTDYYRLGEFIQEQRLVSYTSQSSKSGGKAGESILAAPSWNRKKEEKARKRGLTSTHS